MNLYGYVYIGFKKMGELRRYGTTLETLRIQNYLAAVETESDTFEVFAEKMTNREDRLHYEYLDDLIRKAKNSMLVINSLNDFSQNEDDASELYRKCWKNDVDLEILDSPWLNVGFLKKYHVPLSGAIAMIEVMYKHDRYKVDEIKGLKLTLSECPITSTEHNKGMKLETKKSLMCKAIIIKESMYFDGHLSDPELIDQLGISKNTYYKYKKELRAELSKAKKERNKQ